jgi:hypothetical protein
LLEIPAIHSTPHIVGDLPYLALQGGALLAAGHVVVPVLIGLYMAIPSQVEVT